MPRVDRPLNFSERIPLRIDKPFTVERCAGDKVVVFSIFDPSAIYSRQFVSEVSSFLASEKKVIIDCGALEPYTEQEVEFMKCGKWSNNKYRTDRTRFIATELLPKGESPSEITTGEFAKKVKSQDGVDFTSTFRISYVEEKNLKGDLDFVIYLSVELDKIKPQVEESVENSDYKEDNAAEKDNDTQLFPNDSTNKNKEVFYITNLPKEGVDDVVKDMMGKLFELVVQRGKILNLVVDDSSGMLDDLGIEIRQGGTIYDVDIVLTPPSDSVNQDLYTSLVYEFVRLEKRVNLKKKDILGNEEPYKLEILKMKGGEIKISLHDYDDTDYYASFLSLITFFLSKGSAVVLDIDENRPYGIGDPKFIFLVDYIFESGKEVAMTEESRNGIKHPVFVLKS